MLILLFSALLEFAVLRFAQLPLPTVYEKYFVICDLLLLAPLLVFANLVDGVPFSLLLIRELCCFINNNILHFHLWQLFFDKLNVLYKC